MLAKFAHATVDAGEWTPENIIDDAITQVRDQVGDGQVLLGLSGGVDSSVVAALLHKAIGDQLVCVFVDNGLLRLNEGAQVMETFEQNLGVRVNRATQKTLPGHSKMKSILKESEKSSVEHSLKCLRRKQLSFQMCVF